MNSIKKLFMFFFLLSVLVFTACSDDDKDPVGPEDKGDPPAFAMKPIEVPGALSQSNDPHARMGAAYVSLFNGINLAFITPPSGGLAKITEDPWVYNFEADGFSVTTTVWEDGDKYYWEIVFNGTDGENVFVNWKAMEAWQYVDGHAGEFMVYIEGTTQMGAKWIWVQNSDGSITYEFIDYEGSERLELVINADGSGMLSVYDGEILVMRLSWAANGTGEWWEYNSAGVLLDSGRWP